jgi:prephenate dehydratase
LTLIERLPYNVGDRYVKKDLRWMSSNKAEADGNLPRVAFQGELGAFSEEAVALYFRERAVPVPCRQFTDVAEAVLAGQTEYGLLPIENTTVGAVAAAYDVLSSAALQVVGEVIVPVRHCLLGIPGANLEGIHRALSHPVALAQCDGFFTSHPAIEPVATYDTAGAARQVTQLRDAAIAAVAGRRAADRYQLDILAADIHDRADNMTRFLIVIRSEAKPAPMPAGDAKTALLLETHNRPGALAGALVPLAERGVNLASLQSRPGRDPWTYRFFLEIDGAASDPNVNDAIEVVRRDAVTLRVLGSFPKWKS